MSLTNKKFQIIKFNWLLSNNIYHILTKPQNFFIITVNKIQYQQFEKKYIYNVYNLLFNQIQNSIIKFITYYQICQNQSVLLIVNFQTFLNNQIMFKQSCISIKTKDQNYGSSQKTNIKIKKKQTQNSLESQSNKTKFECNFISESSKIRRYQNKLKTVKPDCILQLAMTQLEFKFRSKIDQSSGKKPQFFAWLVFQNFKTVIVNL
eukprot:TRINITY_DN9724_c0_g1_i1.p1 TRINITY_DN9724_c0_g1~~TRINITY_DN9724_c0_g1_i1.p1  ORF type:complete len:237 (-),score=-5.14 TRINITY_DN9724_c0_g1_i1:131-748(-)